MASGICGAIVGRSRPRASGWPWRPCCARPAGDHTPGTWATANCSHMRVLIVHNFYRQAGGENNVVERLAGMLEARDHTMQVFSADSREVESYSPLQSLRLLPESLYSRRMAARLSRVIDHFRPDVVHVHNVFPLISPSAYWVFQQKRVAVVHTVHNFRFLCPNGLAFTHGQLCFRCKSGNPLSAVRFRCLHGDLKQSLLYALVIGVHRRLNTFGQRTGHLLPVNSLLARLLREAFPAAPITILPNCIESAQYAARTDCGPSFVYLGRLSEEKGVHTLLEALPHTERLRLDVVGEGPWLGVLKRRAEEIAGGRVTFHGHVAGEARFELLRKASALVMPSGSHDACPMAVLEAMALGVPVVASRRGGLPDLVRDGETGLLFEAGQSRQLAAALQRLADAPELVRQMGLAARQRAVAEFDVEVYYRKLLGVYHAARSAVAN